MAISSDAKTGRPTWRKLLAAMDDAARRLATRPQPRKIRTGNPMVPNAPSGSRRKIFVSIQVSFQSPRSIMISLFANRATGKLEKHVLKVRENRTEIGDPDTVLGKTVNHFGHQVVTRAANSDSFPIAGHVINSRYRPKALCRDRVLRSESDGSFWAMPVDEPDRTVDVDDPSVLNDCYPVTQPLGLLHQMGGQEDRLAAIPDATHQIPDRPSRLRIQPSGQLVEKHHLWIVDQRKGNKQALLLASGEIHEPGVPLIGEAELFE